MNPNYTAEWAETEMEKEEIKSFMDFRSSNYELSFKGGNFNRSGILEHSTSAFP